MMIISRDIERAFDNIQLSFLIKTFSKLEIEDNFLKLLRSIYENITSSILLNCVKD